MLKSISKLGTVLSKENQRKITGGNWYPRTEQECKNCGGEWHAPLCRLSIRSICA